jgi:hypothetical protein
MRSIGVLCLIIGCIVGCSTPTATQPTAAAKGSPGALSRQTIVRQGVPNELKQLQLFYADYITTFNRGPANVDDLPDIQRTMPKLYQGIKDGYYVVVWKINTLSPDKVIAYEKEGGTQGQHFVVKGDGSVVKMNEQELQAALAGAGT